MQYTRDFRRLSANIFKVLVVVTSVILLTLVVIQFVFQRYAHSVQTINYGWVGQPHKINPILQNGNLIDQMLAKIVFRGLIKFEHDQTPVGDLADKWEIKDEGHTYCFSLKPNQYWEDDSPITAYDVAFTYQLIQSNPMLLKHYLFLGEVEIEIVNEQTINFLLPEKFAPFLSLLDIGILPKHIWESIPPEEIDTAQTNLEPVGSGPYQVQDLLIDQDFIDKLTLNSIEQNSPQPQINFHFYRNLSDLKYAYQNGDIDSFYDFSTELSREFHDYPNTSIEAIRICGQSINLIVNLANPDAIVGQLEFRNQLRAYLDQHLNSYVINTSSLPEGHWAVDHSLALPVLNDLNLMQFSDPNKSLLIKTSSDQTTRSFAETLRKELDSLNFNFTLEYIPQPIDLNVFSEMEYDLLILSQMINRDPDQYFNWHSSQNVSNRGINFGTYANRQMDQALEDGRVELDRDKRRETYAIMQLRLANDIPAVFIQYPPLNQLSRINSPKTSYPSCIWETSDLLLPLVSD